MCEAYCALNHAIDELFQRSRAKSGKKGGRGCERLRGALGLDPAKPESSSRWWVPRLIDRPGKASLILNGLPPLEKVPEELLDHYQRLRIDLEILKDLERVGAGEWFRSEIANRFASLHNVPEEKADSVKYGGQVVPRSALFLSRLMNCVPHVVNAAQVAFDPGSITVGREGYARVAGRWEARTGQPFPDVVTVPLPWGVGSSLDEDLKATFHEGSPGLAIRLAAQRVVIPMYGVQRLQFGYADQVLYSDVTQDRDVSSVTHYLKRRGFEPVTRQKIRQAIGIEPAGVSDDEWLAVESGLHVPEGDAGSSLWCAEPDRHGRFPMLERGYFVVAGDPDGPRLYRAGNILHDMAVQPRVWASAWLYVRGVLRGDVNLRLRQFTGSDIVRELAQYPPGVPFSRLADEWNKTLVR